MKKKPIILIGAGGHCHSVVDVIESEGTFEIRGLIDLPHRIGEKVYGYEIIASDDMLEDVIKEFPFYLITLGQEKLPYLRVRYYNKLEDFGAQLITLISPFSRVSTRTVIGKGTVIMHNAIINSGVKIGNNCIIHTGAIVEHDCVIENHVQISTSAVLNGNVNVSEQSFIGSNAVLKQSIKIGKQTIIGAGSVITKSYGDNLVLAGNPARELME